MNKKDYQALARAIYKAHDEASIARVPQRIMENVADVLAADNPRFNRTLFIEACETGSCKGMKG